MINLQTQVTDIDMALSVMIPPYSLKIEASEDVKESRSP